MQLQSVNSFASMGHCIGPAAIGPNNRHDLFQKLLICIWHTGSTSITVSSSFVRSQDVGTLSPVLVLELDGVLLGQVIMMVPCLRTHAIN